MPAVAVVMLGKMSIRPYQSIKTWDCEVAKWPYFFDPTHREIFFRNFLIRVRAVDQLIRTHNDQSNQIRAKKNSAKILQFFLFAFLAEIRTESTADRCIRTRNDASNRFPAKKLTC